MKTNISRSKIEQMVIELMANEVLWVSHSQIAPSIFPNAAEVFSSWGCLLLCVSKKIEYGTC